MQLAQAFHDAGLPAGVLNLVFGKPAEISEYLIPQPAVRLVTFTGSIPVGKQLAAMAGQLHEAGHHGARRPRAGHRVRRRRPGRERRHLGHAARSRNAGQVCVSPTRFFVQEAIYKRFTRRFRREGGRAVKVGDGIDPANQMGPLANHRRIETMEALVADAKAKGARVLAGGSRIGNRGYYYPADRAGRPARRRARHARGAVRPARADQSGRQRSTRPSRRRTRCPTGSPPTPSPARRATPTGWPRGSRSAISRSTTSSPRSPRRRSAASRTAATAARAAPRAWRATRSPRTSRT